MTPNQILAYDYLKTIGSFDEFNPVDFFLMVQDTGMTIQECSIALDELQQISKIKIKDDKKLMRFKLK